MSYYRIEEEPEFVEPQLSPQVVLEQQKRVMRQKAVWALLFGVAVLAIHLAVIIYRDYDWEFLFHSVWFVFGVLGLLIGLWSFYEASKLSLQDIIPSPQAIEFARIYQATKPIFSYVLIGCFVVVYLLQETTGFDRSVFAAGLVKPLVWQGQIWRLLTSATLHGGIIHLYFNSQALYGFGKLIETIVNRAHLVIVFLLSAIGSGVFSVLLMPNSTSIGASGGIMGLVGYLVVFGYRRKRDLPPGFLRNILVNVILIGVIGLLGAALIDNAGHAGGLFVGLVYGFLTISKDDQTALKPSSNLTSVLGYLSLLIVTGAAALSIWQMLI